MNVTPRHRLLLVALPLLLTAVACQEVELQPLTNAPPTREASVDEKNHRVRLSEGVALAVRCWDSCDVNCRGAKVTSASPNIRVHRAYRLTELGQTDPYNQGYQPDKQREEVFVLVGQEVGEARVKVSSSCSSQEYKVAILP